MIDFELLKYALAAEERNKRFAIYIIMVFSNCCEEAAEAILFSMGGPDEVFALVDEAIKTSHTKER